MQSPRGAGNPPGRYRKETTLVKNIDVNSGFSSEDADQAVTNAESLPGFVSVTKTYDRKSQSWVVTTVTETH